MSVRAERRAVIALVAVFALLVQALIPSLAMAGPASDPSMMVICTGKGLQTAPSDPGQPAADHACQHCLCPAPTAMTQPPVLEVRSVAYLTAEASHAAAPQYLRPPARAPPRPPGQGPPLSDA